MVNIGVIGSLGDVVFETSTQKVRTFDDLSREGSSRWGTHEILHQKPLSEFVGPGQEDIRFTIRLDAGLGVNPSEELEKLRKMRDTGEVTYLIIGGETVTTNYWYIESIKERQKNFTGRGILTLAVVELSLKEYRRLEVD